MKRRILHVIDSLDLGGAQTFLFDLVTHHDRARYVPEIAIMHGRGVYAHLFEMRGIPIHFLAAKKFPPLYVPNFLRLICMKEYSILHFHLFGANLCAKPIAILAGYRAIVVHDQCNDEIRRHNHILLIADALANRGASRVIAVSASLRRYLIMEEDLADSKVEFIPNAINIGIFHHANEEQRLIRKASLGIAPNAFVVGGVGRLVAQKNFDLFLQVASVILIKYPSIIFAIAGTGVQEVALRQQASDLGISSNIHFLGHVADRVELYHAFDALLITSNFEGMPMALLESMISEVPIVASAVDGIAEICTHEQEALLVPPGDLKQFCSALERVITDPVLRQQLGKNAAKTIRESYGIKEIARKIESIYDQVLLEE